MEPLIAVEDGVFVRLAVCAAASLLGIILIVVGRQNIRSRTAEETGRRRWVNRALGRGNTYTGKSAVMIGRMRIVAGICMIIFGIVFIFAGPFLAQ